MERKREKNKGAYLLLQQKHKTLSTSAHRKMNPILPPVTSSSSSHLQQQYDDEMYSLLPRIEIPDVLLSSTLDHDSESTSSIHKGEPSLKHAHSHDTDHDTNITTKKPKRQHHHDCVHSDTNTTHVHVNNNITMTNKSKSSSVEKGSELTSMTRATAAHGIEMKEKLGISWLIRYKELMTFKQQNGHCNVPRSYAQNQQLANWVINQRKQYGLFCKNKPNRMTAERIAALEKIGVEWGLDNNRRWQMRYEELMAFKQQNGHCSVPRKYAHNKPLVGWVATQRNHYRLLCKGKPSQMTTERVAALEKIGFEWGLDNNSSWQMRYDELIAFKEQHGHCNVPRRYAHNKVLGLWVSSQRVQHGLLCKGKPSHMTTERVAALEKIGFQWSHCTVPYKYDDNKVLAK